MTLNECYMVYHAALEWSNLVDKMDKKDPENLYWVERSAELDQAIIKFRNEAEGLRKRQS